MMTFNLTIAITIIFSILVICLINENCKLVREMMHSDIDEKIESINRMLDKMIEEQAPQGK